MTERFSEEWFRDFCNRINGDAKYRKDAKGWVWPLVFSIKGDERSSCLKSGLKMIVKIYLKDGRCEGLEMLKSEDVKKDEYLLSGNASLWEDLIDRKITLLNSILKGNMKIAGDVKRLTSYLIAADDLVRIAGEIK